ncbi:phosphatidate cytidylyltransferase, putative [Ichthyophthirius multifiliis]|uniref:Phosphatidate cytidylyltransferase, putative n=1 Tax=Ichthyophthirius multifiliis TaxID=5932 RepID=G0QVP8_ICHMU|nr:phosphatidate cytidylyltransferase, putative [Ichthyophthirius multifiliis]EGR30709.1 phosphatidate cytidylyltransferase, putative [Ichthyophthirius multifiliis]|eukprot:XP_004032296.1 phosphatidate cytidylyltransferase, putative [Ichthyophthirius multifiliis]
MIIVLIKMIQFLIYQQPQNKDETLFLITFIQISAYSFYFIIFVFPLAFPILFYDYERGYSCVIFWIIISFQSDNGALFLGSALGKTPFCPRISPKKTWEGVFGAVILSTFTSVLLHFLQLEFIPKSGLLIMVLVGFFGGCFAVFGDLVESFVKRTANIKDSGGLFPGHGGILDRRLQIILLYYFNIILT